LHQDPGRRIRHVGDQAPAMPPTSTAMAKNPDATRRLDGSGRVARTNGDRRAGRVCDDRRVRITIHGRNLPGRTFTSQGDLLENVHVAVQVGKDPLDPVRGDSRSATWEVDVRAVTGDDGELDLRGPAVHGKRGGRFLYLTWGDVGTDGSFAMFRRAKLMVADIDKQVLADAARSASNRVTDDAPDGGRGLVAEIDLTDQCGGPLCARVRPPGVRWSVAG